MSSVQSLELVLHGDELIEFDISRPIDVGFIEQAPKTPEIPGLKRSGKLRESAQRDLESV